METLQNNYIDRDLSWLNFNHRVLMEAKDKSLPIFERLKFLAIYSSNLDEFFRVRVAAIQSLLNLKKKKRKKWGLAPGHLLELINNKVKSHQEELGNIFRNEILPELAQNNILLLSEMPENEEQVQFLDNFFQEEVMPNLHPELLQKGKIAHFLRDQALYLAISMREKEIKSKGEEPTVPKAIYAIVQVPTHYFTRFLTLPKVNDKHEAIFLDDVVRFNLDKIFPGYVVMDSYSIKLTRDADLLIDDEFDGDLVEKINKSLRKRQVGVPSRFLYDESMPPEMLRYLRGTFDLKKREIIPGGRYHNYSDFFTFPNPLSPELERKLRPQLPHPAFDEEPLIFKVIAEKERILHFPYHSYDYVLRFFNEAAIDPQVEEIKTTQYRVASDSAIVNALIRAAQNGKKVTVFVEIKARFDEARNLQSALNMQTAGVKIIYSHPRLKVHAKVALVMRREEGNLKGYAFLSTGNFNENTARIYADHGFFTDDETIIQELNEVIHYLTDLTYKPPQFKRLLVAQFNMRKRLCQMIDREIGHVKEGKKGYILIKLNNLEDPGMIKKLYEASQVGVKIDMIVRGICCLRPGIKGLSENIKVVRIVDQFLEHARAFCFYNNGANDLFLASADWMQRNLDRRVEVGFPIEDLVLKGEILHILNIQLSDNVKATILDADVNNNFMHRGDAPSVRSQIETYNFVASGKRLLEKTEN